MKRINCFKFSVEDETFDKSMISSIVNISKDNEMVFAVYTNRYNIKHLNKNFAILPTYMAKYTNEPMLCWDIISVNLVSNFPGPQKIIYLLEGIIWEKSNTTSYKTWSKIFDNPRINILTINKEHQEILKLTWGRESTLVTTSEEVKNALSKFV